MTVLLALSLVSCAAPIPIDEDLSPFVTRKELLVVSLAQEGMDLYNNGRLFESESRLRKALYLNPELDNVRFNLAISLEKATFFEESEKILNDLLRKYPDNYNYYAALARVKKDQGNYAESEKLFYKAADLAEKQQDLNAQLNIIRSLASLQLSQGNLAAAICHTEQAMQLSVQKALAGAPEIFVQLISLLLSEGKLEKAAYLFDQRSALYFADNSAASLYLRSQILFASGDMDEVILTSERAQIMPGADPIQKFELTVLNLAARYLIKDPKLFELQSEQYTLIALNQTLETGGLTSLYWSPQLLKTAWQMIKDPELQEILEKD